MSACTFCEGPAEQGIWLRRWPDAGGPSLAPARDVRVQLCARHWRWAVVQRRPLRREGWIYG